MALKPNIPEKASYELSFQSSRQSTGVTLLTVGWVPKQEHPVPAASDIAVTPGTTQTLTGQVPLAADARRMEIRVDLPNGRGWGTLTLKINGSIHAEDQIGGDTTWMLMVA